MPTIGENHFWLGMNPVLPDNNRITIPEQLTQSEIIATNDTLFWGVLENENRFVISRFKQPFDHLREQGVDIRRLTSRRVQNNRVTIIPKEFFPDYEGAQSGATAVRSDLQFNYGETLHFITSDALYRNGMCYVLNDKDGRTMADTLFNDTMRPDGGENPNNSNHERRLIPESKIFERKTVVHLETGEVYNPWMLRHFVFEDILSSPVVDEAPSYKELVEAAREQDNTEYGTGEGTT